MYVEVLQNSILSGTNANGQWTRQSFWLHKENPAIPYPETFESFVPRGQQPYMPGVYDWDVAASLSAVNKNLKVGFPILTMRPAKAAKPNG